MAVLVENVFPVGVSNELLDAVTDEMGVEPKSRPVRSCMFILRRTAVLTGSTCGIGGSP